MSRIRIVEDDPGTVVEVNGIDIAGSIRSLTLNMGAGYPAVLEVALLAEDIILDAEGKVRTEVSERLSKVLVAAGWTPPEGAV